jgi:hypothetical protein
MAAKTNNQKTDAEFVEVKRQALVDKHEVLDAIDTRMSKLGSDHDLLINISGKMDTVATLAARHDHVLYGNGNPGLIREVDDLKNCDDKINKRHELEDQGRRDVSTSIRNMWFAVIASALASIVAVVTHFK